MITVMLCAVGAALAMDQAARELAADAKLAMKRADLSLDFVARVTRVPHSRLSDQLNGKTPFTSFWRFTTREMRETDFWTEFLALRAARVNRALVCRDLGTLLARFDTFIGSGHRPMVKADMPTPAVDLPLRGERAS